MKEIFCFSLYDIFVNIYIAVFVCFGISHILRIILNNKENQTSNIWVIFSIGFTALFIGYMSTISRTSGIPDVVSALITLFSGLAIYHFSEKSHDSPNNKLIAWYIIFFISFLFYGAKIGSFDREEYEFYEEPRKKVIQSHMESIYKKEYNRPLKCDH